MINEEQVPKVQKGVNKEREESNSEIGRNRNGQNRRKDREKEKKEGRREREKKEGRKEREREREGSTKTVSK